MCAQLHTTRKIRHDLVYALPSARQRKSRTLAFRAYALSRSLTRLLEKSVCYRFPRCAKQTQVSPGSGQSFKSRSPQTFVLRASILLPRFLSPSTTSTCMLSA